MQPDHEEFDLKKHYADIRENSPLHGSDMHSSHLFFINNIIRRSNNAADKFLQQTSHPRDKISYCCISKIYLWGITKRPAVFLSGDIKA